MLEGLDKIDWRVYQGAYSDGETIAQNIRLLLSDDPKIRSKALSQLREDISHQGSIYPATIAVVPFIIEILESQQSPNPYSLLELLDTLVDNVKEQLMLDDIFSYGIEAGALQVYQPIFEAYPTYRHYLKHESAKIRRISLKLLALNRTHLGNLRILLRKMLRKETSALLKAAIILEFSGLLDGIGDRELGSRLYNIYNRILEDYLRPENERLVRLAAASAMRNRWLGNQQIKKQVLDIYFDALKLPINAQDFADFSVDSDSINEITKPYSILAKIGQFDLQSLMPRLQDSTLSPLYVHYIGRELVDKVFQRSSRSTSGLEKNLYWKWRQFDGWVESKNKAGTAVYSVSKLEYISKTKNALMTRDQRAVLEALVNCDAFWQIPSNLFSFFYGLPDEREELRKLLV